MGRVTQHRPGRRLAAALLLAGAALTACGPLARVGHHPPAPGAEPARLGPASGTGPARHLVVGGRERTYVVHRPTERPNAAGLPVLLILHGRFGTAENTARLTHFDRVADRAGFLAVYPEGVDRSWSDARGTTEASTAGVDDVAFISALIDELVTRDGVDPARVYVTGFSNGGILTQQLGCQIAGKLAGIAPVAGPMPPNLPPACHPSRPLPVLEIHGTADPVVPYQGGTVRAGREDGQVISAPASADAWRGIDGCAAPRTVPLPHPSPDATTTTVSASDACQAHTAVRLYTVAGGGHTWPGGEQYLPEALIGPTSRQFDASQTIWDFFEHAAR